MPGVSSALAERLTGGRYVDVDIDRAAAARYGLNIADVQGDRVRRDRRRERRRDGRRAGAYPDQPALSARDARHRREAAPAAHPDTARASQITLGTVARIGADRTARPCSRARTRGRSSWVYVDVRGRDLASVVNDLRTAVAREVDRSRPA